MCGGAGGGGGGLVWGPAGGAGCGGAGGGRGARRAIAWGFALGGLTVTAIIFVIDYAREPTLLNLCQVAIIVLLLGAGIGAAISDLAKLGPGRW